MQIENLELKAAAGDRDSQYLLSLLYEDGIEVPEDAEKAFIWCKKSAHSGDKVSAFRLSKMYRFGRGTEKSEILANDWLCRAAELGHAEAQYCFALSHFLGIEGASKSLAIAKDWFLRAAEQNHAESFYYLGILYQYGKGVESNEELAFSFYCKSADLNCPSGQCAAAFMYEHGRGCQIDTRKSWKYYFAAANGGHVGAQYGIACLCFSLRLHQDALVWFDIAANNGVAPAQAILSHFYYHGIATKKNLEKALMWSIIARTSKSLESELLEMANLSFNQSVLQSSRAGVAEARRLAEEWLLQRERVPESPCETNWSEIVQRDKAHYFFQKRTRDRPV